MGRGQQGGHAFTPEEARAAGSKGGSAQRTGAVLEAVAKKLDWPTVRRIRERWCEPETTVRSIAAEFGLAQTMVRRIVNGRAWRPDLDPAASSSPT